MSHNYSSDFLKRNLVKDVFMDTVYYYSVGNKDQKNLSIFSNERLLVLDFDRGKLFYNSQLRGLPFRENPPKPKNIVLDVA